MLNLEGKLLPYRVALTEDTLDSLADIRHKMFRLVEITKS